MNTIGIRREDKDEWEARAPLVPDDVARLVRSDLLRFIIQPSTQRVFPEEVYLRAGAHVDEDLSACGVVLAVKEIPRDFFLAGRTYAFFSHTIKGQPYNMDMLRRLMELGCQLIDFERVTDDRGRRLIYFSRFAGLAGSVDTLWALGRRLRWEGLTPNPFAAVEQTYRYPTLSGALAAVREAAKRIVADGLPAELCPFVVGISGYGNVSLGAQEVVDALGATSVVPAELDGLFAAPADRHAVYKVVFAEQDMVVRRDAVSPFELGEYYRHPELYAGKFDAWLPRLAVLLNCVYWEDAYPRLVTKSAVRRLFAGAPPLLRVIGDISCDIEGSVELTARETHIDDPVYVYDPEGESIADGVAGKGPVVLAVGNLPCELPREASAAFSAALSPFVPALAAADFDAPRELLGLPAELRRALILHHGELTPDYAYMQRFV